MEQQGDQALSRVFVQAAPPRQRSTSAAPDPARLQYRDALALPTYRPYRIDEPPPRPTWRSLLVGIIAHALLSRARACRRRKLGTTITGQEVEALVVWLPRGQQTKELRYEARRRPFYLRESLHGAVPATARVRTRPVIGQMEPSVTETPFIRR